jgi:hypothetical protein
MKPNLKFLGTFFIDFFMAGIKVLISGNCGLRLLEYLFSFRAGWVFSFMVRGRGDAGLEAYIM